MIYTICLVIFGSQLYQPQEEEKEPGKALAPYPKLWGNRGSPWLLQICPIQLSKKCLKRLETCYSLK